MIDREELVVDNSTKDTLATGLGAGRRPWLRRATAVLASGALVFGVLTGPATVTATERPSTGGSVNEQAVAWGVPAWMPRMFWNQVNKQHTTPRCFGEWCGEDSGIMA
jgi:hypothetical protein